MRRKDTQTPSSKLSFTLRALTCGLAIGAWGCSEQAFVPGLVENRTGGGGFLVLPAKVDILLAEDNTPSIIQSLDQINAQLPVLLNKLEAGGWDYRLVTTPLSTSGSAGRPIDQILASSYDGNWAFNGSGRWLPPYPGAQPDGPGMHVLSSLFATPSNYDGFISLSEVDYTVGQYESGFKSIRGTIDNYNGAAQFLRSDAMLAILVIGNGEDGSDVNFCSVPGLAGQVPCELDPACYGAPGTCERTPNATTTFNSYRDYFVGLAQGANKKSAQVKFYSVVAYQSSTSGPCLQGNSTKGHRYKQMATALGGASFDLCTQPIPMAIDNLAQSLSNVKLALVTHYMVIGEEPEPSSIEVIRYVGGDPNRPEVIPQITPQNPDNGWRYLGGPMEVFTIDEPIEMNKQRGYVIELVGTAKLRGNDSGTVQYNPKGGTPSSG